MTRTELKWNNKVLSPKKTITQLGITEGAVINLLYTTVKIKVELSNTETIEILQDPKDTIYALKEAIEDQKNIPADKQILRRKSAPGPESTFSKAQLAKGLLNACEFAPNAGMMDYQINNCVKLYKGALTGDQSKID